MTEPVQTLLTAVLGLGAGLIGGLAGIGGSLIMIPGLAFLYGYHTKTGEVDPTGHDHHLFMASAMCVNALVSFPAAVRHHKAGALHMPAAKVLTPSMALAIIAGVLVSNTVDGVWLKYLLAGFIATYCAINIFRVFAKKREPSVTESRATTPRLVAIGVFVGLMAGVLGIGGGLVMVPLLQLLCKMPLRASIGTSSGVMCITALVGASAKLISLSGLDLDVTRALQLAAVMGPLAMIGGWLGAKLTHTLPLDWVRAIISILLIIAAAKLAGLL